MTKFLKEKLEEKKNNLLEIYQGLKKLQRLSPEDLKENIENVWSVAFGLVAGIEAILDISQYILADKGIKVESYGRIPDKLLDLKLTSQEFADKFHQMIGFRNRAIHNYPSLEPEELYKILQQDIEDFKKFLKLLELWY